MLVVAVIAGCTKKKDTNDKEFASSTPATTPAASQDIFDEFYKEDSTATTSSTAPVPEPEPEPVRSMAPAPEFSPNGRFCVQVSTVASRTLADEVAAQLESKGYPSYIAEVNNPTPSLPGTYYRIRIGGFTGISAAKSFGDNSLVPDGYDYWVDNRSNDNVGLEGYGMGEGTETYGSQPASDYSTGTSDYSTPSSDYSTTPDDYSQPSTDYQPTPPATETQPATDYTPGSTTDDYGTTPSTTTPATTTPEATPPESGGQSEWGNDDW